MAMYNNSSSKNTKPNVIWILSDQHRAQATGYMGDINARTPNMDRLAVTGANFVNAYSGYPLCCPFRGSMLTGVYPNKCVKGHEYELPEGMKTVADCFNTEGYDTFYLGKWHLDGAKEKVVPTNVHIVPRHRRGGFKKWIGYENNNSQYDVWLHGHMDEEEVPLSRLKGYETDALTDMFIDYLNEKNESKEPFFAVLSVQPPHEPHVAPPEFMEKYNPADIKLRPNVACSEKMQNKVLRDLAGYYAQIENFDYNLGRILKQLIETGQYFNTHVIVFSDHGDCHGSNGHLRKNIPFEEATRIPFIISGEIPAPYNFDGRLSGDIKEAMINHVDIAPTTLGLCGIEKPEWMEGTDYSGYRLEWRKRPENMPDSVYLQSIVPTLHGNGADRPWRGIVTNDGWKYVCFEDMPWLMYNLNEDPYEMINLALEPPYFAKRAELHKKLQEWIVKTGDQFTLPEIRTKREL
jgi:arylsulfatase A-like enzyme